KPRSRERIKRQAEQASEKDVFKKTRRVHSASRRLVRIFRPFLMHAFRLQVDQRIVGLRIRQNRGSGNFLMFVAAALTARAFYWRSTVKRLIEYPSAPPMNTSDRKCEDRVSREIPTSAAAP